VNVALNNFMFNAPVSFITHISKGTSARVLALHVSLAAGSGRMDLKLHLGAHRCATSSFQSYIWANRAALTSRGVTCWTPKRTRDGLLQGMVRPPFQITLEDERQAVRSTGRLRIEFDRLEREGQAGLLISDENLMGTHSANLQERRLYPLLDERLLRFREAFEGRLLHIGLCIRSYEDYWTSAMADLLVRGMGQPSPDVLDLLTTQPRRWRNAVRDIAAVFPQAKITIWPFERMAARPDMLLDLFAQGASQGLPQDGEIRNRSADIGTLNRVLALRGDTGLRTGSRGYGSRWMPFDEDQTQVLRAEYRRDIAWLKAGAEGLATYADGRSTPDAPSDKGLNVTERGTARAALETRGHDDGIEKGLGRPRAG